MATGLTAAQQRAGRPQQRPERRRRGDRPEGRSDRPERTPAPAAEPQPATTGEG